MNPYVESVSRSEWLLELKPWEPPLEVPLPRKTRDEEPTHTPPVSLVRGARICLQAIRYPLIG